MATFESAAAWVARALRPLVGVVETDEDLIAFVEQLGWTLPSAPPALRELQDSLGRLYGSLAEVGAARWSVESGESPSSELESARSALVLDLFLVADQLHALPARLRDELPTDYVAVTGIDEELERRAWEWLLAVDLSHNSGVAYRILRVLGVIESTQEPEDLGRHQPAFRRYRVHGQRLLAIFQDPAAVARDVYGWSTPSLDGERLFAELVPLSFALGFPAELRYPEPAFAERIAPGADEGDAGPAPELWIPVLRADEVKFFVVVYVLPKASPAEKQGLALTLVPSGAVIEEIPLDHGLALRLEAAAQIGTGATLVLRPDRLPSVVLDVQGAGTDLTSGRVAAWLVSRPPEWQARAGVSETGGTRIEASGIALGLGAEAIARTDTEVFAELRIDEGHIVLAPPADDGFLSTVLPAGGLDTLFSVTIRWSRRGLHFGGAAGLDTTLPLQASLGPLHLRELHVGLSASDATLAAETSLTAIVTLGPVVVTLERIGLGVTVRPEPGNVGPFDISIGFKRPASIGLLVDAGPVTGGGFLGYDEATGRYVGALELEVYDFAVKAFGILDTRLPGGRPAYSFLIIVSTEFTPIPIGFGFTLNGVGGLAGIHRRLAVDVFRQRLGQGTLDHILFPANPIQDAPQIVSDLQAVLPPAADRYVFGPMAIIAWGVPALLEGKLAILLELPDPVRLVLLGQFHIALPRQDSALVTLNLDLVGELEPARQRLALDGRLHDSNVVGFPIEGELAVRIAGGSDRSLALSIGGFNPSFRPPAGFPKLQRITIPIGLDDNPRITLEGYLALTSNTLQVGALATLYAEAGWFNITGHVGFDALFTRSPFSFLTDFSAKVALNKGKTQIAAIKLEATISGLAPWHVAGEACLEIPWLPDICVGVNETFGEEVRVELPTVDPFPPLREAVANPESWSGERPPGLFRAATTATPAGASGRGLVDPAEGVTLRQTVVPLDRQITRFGASQPPGGAVRFDIQTVTLGTVNPPWTPVQDHFAPAQFEDLSDDEKLSRPDFERMAAGLTVARDALTLGQPVSAAVEYETRIIDSTFQTRPGGPYHPTRDLQLAAAALSSAAVSPLRNSGPAKFAPPPAQPPMVSLSEERFVVVSTMDLSERRDIVLPAGKGAAFQALAAHLAAHPEDRGRLEVLSIDELSTAA